MITVNLNSNWELRSENLNWDIGMAQAVLDKKDGWMACHVPCDIHMPLIENGLIKEPLDALNCFDCEWIEEKSWWFRKTFDLNDEILESDVIELTLESLDAEADIYLNGFHLAHHKSAFYPFTADVGRFVRKKENILLVRLTSGLEYVSQSDLSRISRWISTEMDNGRWDRGDKRRVFVRKPQFAYGWDWGPRVATCGIMKNVYIKAYRKVAVRGCHVVAKSTSGGKALLDIKVEVENLHPFRTCDATVSAALEIDGKCAWSAAREEFLLSGTNFVKFEAEINNPRFWWPNGMGSQDLYTVRIHVNSDGVETFYPEFRYGIRTVRLNTEKISKDERLFVLEINGVKTFCKGANWIPADSIYARVSDEKYDRLLREAKEANFNMLRVWGGGLYERDIFYDKCDEYGLLVWHDFMFACAMYPDNLEWFAREAERELDYQTRRLRNHSCIALWCGNNENHWAFRDWWPDCAEEGIYGGAEIYNKLAPAIIEKNCPDIPYWNSSPYGGDSPNCSEMGDRHHWHDCTMNKDIEKRITPEEYDKVTAKFVSEYGYIGPCAKSSIIRYHGNNEVVMGGEIWNLHTNSFERETVAAGITRHYTDAASLDLDSYLLYAGLCQGLMYQYSLESIRFRLDCWGSLFWMYNDCWGETGWSIIDYYLVRKPSFYYVKRAFEPLKLILRERDNSVLVLGVNDTGNEKVFDLEYGYLSLDGETRATSKVQVKLPPYSRGIAFSFDKPEYDHTKGVCFVKPDCPDILPATLRKGVFRELDVEKPDLRIANVETSGDKVIFTIKSDVFAHGVHFNLGDGICLSDEYFDLLPQEERRVVIYNPPDGFDAKNIKPAAVI